MEYTVGDVINQDFLILKSSVEKTKKGKSYIKFDVRDENGIEFTSCKMWDSSVLPKHPVMAIFGKVDEYEGQRHIIAKGWGKGEKSIEAFSPRAPWPLDGKKLWEKFSEKQELIRNEELQDWIREFILFWTENDFPSMKPGGADLVNATGAISLHHSYKNGWLEHTIEVVDLCNAIASVCGSTVHDWEKDLLLAGAFIHDIGKLFQIEYRDGFYQYTKACKAYGWCSNAEQIMGTSMILAFSINNRYPPGGPNAYYALINMIASHHGNQYSIGNPIYIISKILHHADHVSANVNRMQLNLHDKDEVDRDKVRESYMRIKEA